YSGNERGTSWSVWNTAHQVGGGLILVLAGYLTDQYGWRASFYVPAAIAVVCSIFLINRLRDTPESLGLPSIEDYRDDHPVMDADADSKADAPHAAMPMRDIFFKHVLRNRQIWFLSLANFFVYLVRYGAMDWAPTFLVEVKHSTVANASYKTALFEVAGIAGSILAGRLTDTRFAGKRALLNVLYMIGLVFAVLGFWLMPEGHPWLECFSLAAVGFLVYGPQMMVGICAADAGGKYAAATATGFTGLFGYLGGIVSGIGTGWIVDHFGWSGGFLFFTASAIIGALCFVATGDKKTKLGQESRPTPALSAN
ncbi:MAG: MFS transporter, partial [Deltaproteobacteria bacterium]|nr:MFS transporter [Deltaproteobacteria bacterium]